MITYLLIKANQLWLSHYISEYTLLQSAIKSKVFDSCDDHTKNSSKTNKIYITNERRCLIEIRTSQVALFNLFQASVPSQDLHAQSQQ